MSDAPLKFAFDRQFESSGSEDPVAPLVRRKLGPEEVEAARQEAFAAGQASAEAEAQRRIADAAEALAATARDLGGILAQERAEIVTDAANLGVMAAKRLAAGVLSRWPEAEIEAFLTQCLAHMRDEPRLVLSAHPELEDALKPAFEMAGGRLSFASDGSLPPGDARIEWTTGSARLERAAAEIAIDAELETFLAGAGAPPNESEGEDG